MSTIRIAVASTPLTATLDEAVPAAVAAVEEAGRLGARIVCLPETGLPGHRDQARPVPDVSADALDAALREVAEAARRAGVVTIVGAERPTPAGREIVSVVFGADGARLGEQVKTQIDPSEERALRRRAPAAACSRPRASRSGSRSATRRSATRRSAARSSSPARRSIFVPHFVTTDDGSLPTRWCDASNPYNEKAVMCRALENTVYVAASNVAGPDQGSVTCIIAPDGTLVASLDYGAVGVVAADIDLDLATRLLALRWAPERSVVA